MKAKTLITILLVAIILASCNPVTTPIPSTFAPVQTAAAINPTFTPVPTTTATPPNERTHILLQQDTALYSGPSNADFDVIKTLKTSETVYPLGAYDDFIQVEVNVDGNDVTGFIHKNS